LTFAKTEVKVAGNIPALGTKSSHTGSKNIPAVGYRIFRTLSQSEATERIFLLPGRQIIEK